jgi:hypothetical protein
MKSVLSLLILAFFLSVNTVFAQEKTNVSVSNAELFSGKPGTLIQHDYTLVGFVSKAKIQLVSHKDLSNNDMVSAFRFEFVHELTDKLIVAYLDEDEIDGMIQSVSKMQKKVVTTTPENETDITYRSRGGVAVGCYWLKKNWQTYLKLGSQDSDFYLVLKTKEFQILLDQLKAGKVMIE